MLLTLTMLGAKPRPPCPTPPEGNSLTGWLNALQPEREHLWRWCAAEKLGELGDLRAVPALMRALSDDSGYVRHHAVASLGLLNDERALPSLIRALDPRNAKPPRTGPWGLDLRRDIVETLRRLAWTKAKAQLFTLTKTLLSESSPSPHASHQRSGIALTDYADLRSLRPALEHLVTTTKDAATKRLAVELLSRWEAPPTPPPHKALKPPGR